MAKWDQGENKPFRDGRYCKRIWIGKRTVKQGECAAIWDDKGTCTLVEGPRRIWATFSTIRFLTFHRAGKQEYIVVQYKDGRKENIPGPKTVFENPVEHTSIEVKPAIQVNTSEALVVYKDCRLAGHTKEAEGKKAAAGALGGIVTMKDESISRRIFQGPALFVPHADEWVHTFKWTLCADEANDGNEVAKDSKKDSKFIKLQLNSRALAYTVTKVRTADEASLDIQLVAFVQLVDVDRMLDSSVDPTRDLMQAISADVFRFGGKHSLEALLERSSLLSDLENFPSLRARAEQMGFKISDILYRGYKTSSDLERMLDQTVTSRHKQRLAQEELVSEQRKQELSRALQTEQDKFEAARASEKHEQELLLQAKAFEQRLLLSAKQDEATIGALARMKDIGIDLNRYMECLALSAAQSATCDGRGSGGGQGVEGGGGGRGVGDPSLRLARQATS